VFARVLQDSLAASASASDLLLPKVDLSELFPVPASRWLAMRGHQVRTAEPIKAIERHDDGYRLDGDPWRSLYDHVVIATAPYHVAALVEALPAMAPVTACIGTLRHEPIVTSWLAFDGPVHFPDPMIGLSGGYGQWAFDRAALGGPEGLVGVVISASGTHQEISKEALEIALVAELQAPRAPASPQVVEDHHRKAGHLRLHTGCRPPHHEHTGSRRVAGRRLRGLALPRHPGSRGAQRHQCGARRSQALRPEGKCFSAGLRRAPGRC
jgi:hypothetical protein